MSSTSVYVCIYSGGTEVTVSGTDLDSVAEPYITATVVTTRNIGDVNSTSSKGETDLEVRNTFLFFRLLNA